MKILLDTNILILRENNHIIPDNVARMMNLLNGLENCSLQIHALSKQEIEKDGNIDRKSINLSKISSYALIEPYPDYLSDSDFSKLLEEPKTTNDVIDNQLLYCIVKNVADYLITEDQGILNKADGLGLEQVLNINEAISLFEKFYPNPNIDLLSTFTIEKGFNINLKDEIFGTLENEYKGFETWWSKKVSTRDVYVYKNPDAQINALLVPKIETNEKIDCTPELKADKILKICTFKVAEHSRGLKLGERLLWMAFDYARLNDIDTIYLTHFRQENDYLIHLIENYGFYKYGVNKEGEEIYLKKILKDTSSSGEDFNLINKKYYPSFYDGPLVKKHIVPIDPTFHKKLFPDFRGEVHQLSLAIEENSEGNSIKKAYVCNAATRKIKKGDILLFYQSQDKMAVTTIGTVEAVYSNLSGPEDIFKLIAKRTVFSLDDIHERCNANTLVILFNQNIHLTKEVPLEYLEQNDLINGNIQSITEINDDRYRKIIEGNIDERFIIH